ncbi:MAG: No hits [uncultured Sulfurovum sp.]|uniref:No hits n=1 Tax=uncultured Sulfurovum sp. TaxID=269237 RepID=A0A6S6TLR5_9BACT|nr:MAG: No hits [uncultured Sulfurovum sp.]
MKTVRKLGILFLILISFSINAHAEILDTNNWTPYRGGITGGLVTEEKHSGTHSMKIINEDNLRSGWHYPAIPIDNKKTVTFAGWNKAENVSEDALNTLDFSITFDDGTHEWYYPNELRFSKGTHDWEKVEHTVTFDKEIVSIKPYAILNYKKGTVWFDDISVTVEEEITTDWKPYRGAITGGIDTNIKHSGTHSMKIINEDNLRSGWHYPTIPVNNKKTVTFTGWNKAENVSEDALNALDFSITFDDGTHKWYYPDELRFSKGTHDWEKVEHTVTFDKEIVSIKPYAILNYKKGTVWFDDISVKVHSETTVSTTQDTYTQTDQIVVLYENMSNSEQDWIGIFPEGSASTLQNAIQWEFKNNQNMQTFESLPAGNYEVRVFFNNTLNVEASHSFTVENTAFNVESRKPAYDPFELIYADFVNMRGAGSDWIGIFPVGATHSKESAIEWKYAKSLVNGSLSFNGLPVGTYEMRASFATLHKKTLTFNVQDTAVTKIVYETAENGFEQEWGSTGTPVTIINTGAQGSNHSVRATRYVGSYFSFSNPDKKLRFLEFDTRIGTASHVGNFGVIVQTKEGKKRIVFSSYMNHPGNVFTNNPEDFRDPFSSREGYVHNHPGPTDYYMETRNGNFIHYKINIEEKLRMLEPDNELISITHFTSAGGDFDNIQLVSH